VGRIQDYFNKQDEEYNSFAGRPKGRPPLMRYWVFRVKSPDSESFLVIEEETQQEAVDQLPTNDSFYTRDQLREMEYNIRLGPKTVRQCWTSQGERTYLDFYLSDYFYSAQAARDHISKMTKEKVQ